MQRLPAIIILFLILTINTIAKDDSLHIGSEAPTFSLPSLDGDYVALRNYCGNKLLKPWKNTTKHVVVLSFFATWCKPCMKEIPYLEQLQNEYKGKDIKFFLVDVGEKKDVINRFLEKNPVSLPILIDPYQKTAEKYNALKLPRLFVIDKEGIIRREQKGFKNADEFESEMRNLLDKLLNNTK